MSVTSIKSGTPHNGCWIANDDPRSITNQATHRFIQRIQDQRQLGYGFVPLIGAGFSAPAGAPIERELITYLERCIGVALGVDVMITKERPEPWNPRTDQWPPWVDRRRMVPEGRWKHEISGLIQKPQNSIDRDVLERAFGAIGDWRGSLHFLSRLERQRRRGGDTTERPIKYAEPLQEIVDACFREVLKNKYPSLCHRMLAALAGALRLDLMLTTNFDNLLEQAFAEARNPLEIFDVQLTGALPNWSALSDVRSLIKLHGSRHSLRANYSLDAYPAETDKATFLEYLVSREWHAKGASPSEGTRPIKARNHLLVMGYSARDLRVRGLIEYAWSRLPNFRAFWLCYSQSDVEYVQEFTKEAYRIKDKDWTGANILRCTDLGLFLLQLYQTIRKNLPPLGSVFPSVSRLTLPPSVKPSEDENKFRMFREALMSKITSFQSSNFTAVDRLVVATSAVGLGGVTSACAAVFRALEAQKVCIWLDMNDVSSTDNLFEVLLEAAYFRLGVENWTPVYIGEDTDRPRAAEFRRLIGSINKPWVIFINARETPGANSVDHEDVRGKSPHLWLDRRAGSPGSGAENLSSDESSSADSFVKLLHKLWTDESEDDRDELPSPANLTVVLLCRSADPGANEPGLLEALRELKMLHSIVELTESEADSFSEDEVVRRSLEWAGRDPRQRRFLQALVLMQRPRLLSTVWSRAASPRGGIGQLEWVDQLEAAGLVRRKPGGFIWIHSRSRQALRAKLQRGSASIDPKWSSFFHDWRPWEDEPEIHGALAEWYSKLLDASESPSAVFEAVYHFCQVALTHSELRRASESVEAAAALLKRNSFLVQTHGYSRGSCRKLEYVRDILCRSICNRSEGTDSDLAQAAQRLRIVSTEIMRQIAREVGEDAKAYLRHRQFGIQIAKGDWTEELKQTCDTDQDFNFSEEMYKALAVERRLPSIGNHAAQWLRWLRWCGMLGIASRSFTKAQEALEMGLRYATERIDGYRRLENYRREKGPFRLELLSESEFVIPRMPEGDSRSQGVRIEVLRLLEQYVELLALQAGAQRRLASFRDSDTGVPGETEIQAIEECIDEGRRGSAVIRAHDHSPDSHDTVRANWCESRLLMHASVCAGMRVQANFGSKDSQVQTAMAFLGDAEAILRVSEPGRRRTELAMVELHRAEARLREAEAVPIHWNKGTPASFAQLCRNLEGVPQADPGWEAQGVKIRADYLGANEAQVQQELQRASALVADAARFLNRAEPVLRERRRNVWWTTWFFERRLRTIALSVWASVFEQDGPIPFLGLEAAMRDTPTTADTLLDDALRMIRVDAYRLATVVDAYASCAKALQMRLILDPQTIALPVRQETMRRKLKGALEVLGNVRARRDGGGQVRWQKVDDHIAEYVGRVQARSGGIATQLKTRRHR